jgi:malate synthase
VLGERRNQKDRLRDDVAVERRRAARPDRAGRRGDRGRVRANVRVALAYLDSWLRGVGAAAIDNLMEDAATAEISRSQLWFWRTRGVTLADGRAFDGPLYEAIRDEELARLGGAGEGRLREAADLLDRLVLDTSSRSS